MEHFKRSCTDTDFINCNLGLLWTCMTVTVCTVLMSWQWLVTLPTLLERNYLVLWFCCSTNQTQWTTELEIVTVVVLVSCYLFRINYLYFICFILKENNVFAVVLSQAWFTVPQQHRPWALEHCEWFHPPCYIPCVIKDCRCQTLTPGLKKEIIIMLKIFRKYF